MALHRRFPAQLESGHPQAGKTGTTNNAEAVWFAGYTPDMAGVALIAADNGPDFSEYWKSKGNKRIDRVNLVNGGRLAGSGGGDAGLIWKAAMAAALADTPARDFTGPTKEILEGVKVPVPDVKGMSASEAEDTLKAAGFSTQRTLVYSDRRKGSFLGIEPSKEAVKFSTIRIKISNGPKPEPVVTAPPSAPPVAPPPNPDPED